MHVADPLTKDPLYASAKQQAQSYLRAAVERARHADPVGPLVVPELHEHGARCGDRVRGVLAADHLATRGRSRRTSTRPAAGLDPNSPEYQKSQQAGKGISALAEFGAQNLEGNQAADQTYFQGQAANASGALPGVMAGCIDAAGQLGSQVAGKTQELYQGLHAQAVNEDIARQTSAPQRGEGGRVRPAHREEAPR
jgi:hypothetical protein